MPEELSTTRAEPEAGTVGPPPPASAEVPRALPESVIQEPLLQYQIAAKEPEFALAGELPD